MKNHNPSSEIGTLMLALDAISPSPIETTTRARRKLAVDQPRTLAKAIASLDIENHERWAWKNYKRVVRDLCGLNSAHRLVEIGGGRDPLFDRTEIEDLGVEMTVNDISPGELAVLPQGYQTACFDVAGDISSIKHLRCGFDLAFSRMVFEHVSDGQRAWANVHELLAPGGIALAFIPTLYSVPFVLNWLLPDKLAAAIVKAFFPNRTDEEDPVFPARYSWCFADEARMRSMLSAIGYREIVVQPFYGHGYYDSFPIIRDVHKWFTSIARRKDWRMLASHAYIIARK
jgi:SAM-dependent methyltransferase